MDKEIFDTVLDFNKFHGLSLPKNLRVLDLVSEIGEVCKLEFSEKTTGKQQHDIFEEELGDCLYSLLSLFSEADVSPKAALSRVLIKYSARINKTGKPDSGK